MVAGAILGGVLGHQVIDGSGRTSATIEGGAPGALLGSAIGHTAYLIDELKTAEALESSCDGRATTWSNADTGQRYSVTPTQTSDGSSLAGQASHD